MEHLKIWFGTEGGPRKSARVFIRADRPWFDLKSVGKALNYHFDLYEGQEVHRLEMLYVEVDPEVFREDLPEGRTLPQKPIRRQLVSPSGLIGKAPKGPGPGSMTRRADIIDLIQKTEIAIQNRIKAKYDAEEPFL